MAELSAVVAGMASGDAAGAEPKQLGRIVIPVWLAVTGGTVTRRQLGRYLDISDETLTRDLRKLSEARYLVREGKGRGSLYRPGPRVESWGDFEQLVEIAMSGGVASVRDWLAQRAKTTPETLF